MRSSPTEPLHELADAWTAALRPAGRRLTLAIVVLLTAVALLVARQGTSRARVAAGAGVLASLLCAFAWDSLVWRRVREPARLLSGPGRRVDSPRANRALRALAFVGPSGDIRADGVSVELATLHVGRALADLPTGPILQRGQRLAGRLSVACAAATLGLFGLLVARAWWVVEGADILVARGAVAPVAMTWLGGIELTARPPEYLHEAAIQEIAMTALALPYGTAITVRGDPVHPNHRLLLSDGTTEVPFVEDGAGAVIARWELTESATLHIVARFGDVVIAQAEPLEMKSIPDDAPVVRLEAAPRQVRLIDADGDIPIKYEATDDHGLREVHLVLRSGGREDRRVLSRLDGETKTDAGGQSLRVRDPFLRRSHAPVEVTVEAKDNDPLTGPKWGASAAITVVPPDVGEPEALRLDALRKVRDAAVDTLAWRLDHPPPASATDRKAFVTDGKKRIDDDELLMGRTLSSVYAGVRVSSRSRGVLLAQEQATRRAVDAELASPSPGTHATAVKATERMTLVVDAIVRGLGMHDTREAARQLADVADDLANGAEGMPGTTGDVRARSATRMDVSALVLAAGARGMQRLGELGRDLGEIVDADLLRVQRARATADFAHAELAARDLAARLRQPDPSFGARGSVGKAGGESGGERGAPGDDEPDDVEQAFDQAAGDLERLSQDHAGEMGKVEQALAGATSDEEGTQMRDEARRHADAIRDAARSLPAVGMGSDSWTSKGSAARELAEQSARSLEQGRAEDAVESGRGALGALDDAKRLLQSGSSFEDPTGSGQRRVDDARRKLDAEAKWMAEELREVRKRAADRAHGDLQQGGEEERQLADRARDLARQGRDRGSLPEEAVASIDEAERAARLASEALKQGDADKGVERQREAQRHLEAARQQLEGEDEGGGSSPSGGSEGRRSESHVDVPKDHKGPEEFRRRVVRGLGQATTGSLKDAVRRYAEGLLR